MKPTIGRIVHVLVDPRHNNGSDTAPAIITRAWDDHCVNLRVLHDGPSAAPEGRYDWLTSWSLHESREAVEAKRGELQAAENVAAAAAGRDPNPVTMYAAFWPPRAEHQPGDRPVQY